MKLELKHLLPYLPYNLNVLYFDNYGEKIFAKMTVEVPEGKYKSPKNEYPISHILSSNYAKAFPILRPLSDLTKEIEANGKRFVPIHYLDENFGKTKHKSSSISFTDNYVEMAFYDEYQQLFEWNFDVFGLIKENLAIDINLAAQI